MRFLVLSLTLPYPPSNGHKLRNWAVLRALAAEGHQLSLLTFAEPNEFQSDLAPIREVTSDLEIVPIKPVGLSSGEQILSRALSLARSSPYAVTRFKSREMAEKIRRRVESGRHHALLAETPYALINLRSKSDVPLILDNHNIEHKLLERYQEVECSKLRRAYAGLESWKLKTWELGAWKAADHTWACSHCDKELIEGSHRGIRCSVIPNVVDLDSYRPSGDGQPTRILFTGGMDWHPNRDAVEYFATEMLPILRWLRPGVELVVAGRGPSAAFRQRFSGTRGVEFTGTVADMRSEIQRASVCVVPLRIGSGTRLKILEAAGMAKPVVSTSIGAEGLEFEDGKEIVLADEPEKFARAVATLLADRTLARMIGAAARRKAEASYSLQSLRSAINNSLQEIASAGKFAPERSVNRAA